MTPGGAAVLLPDETALQSMLTEATTLSTAGRRARSAVMWKCRMARDIDSLDALAASRLNYAGYATHISAADRKELLQLGVDRSDRFSRIPQTSGQSFSVLGLTDSANQVSQPDPNSKVAYRLILGVRLRSMFPARGTFALSHSTGAQGNKSVRTEETTGKYKRLGC